MKLLFRQGIVKGHVDSSNNPDYIINQPGSDYISLYINEIPTLITFADGQYNYLYEESSSITDAWGPFNPPFSPKYWLYWDINKTTGIRTFGFTVFEPIVSSNTPVDNQDKDQHWFDTSTNTMRVYNGTGWAEKLRVFAGEYSGGALIIYDFGTQVNLDNASTSGFILFDESDNPIKRKNGSFLTSESQLYTTKSTIGSVRVDANTFYAAAIENIPAYSVVSFYDDNKIGLASYDDVDYKPAGGFIKTLVYQSEITNIITTGYISNVDWNFILPPSTPLYLGLGGELTTVPPTSGFIQKIGTVVSRDTIFISIDPPIRYNEGNLFSNIPLSVDTSTGILYTSPSDAIMLPPAGPGEFPTPSDMLSGFTYTKVSPTRTWTITHNLNSPNALVQCYDDQGKYVLPNNIHILDNNNISVTFGSQTAGKAQVIVFRASSTIIVPDSNVAVYDYTQTIPAKVWTIDHGIGREPIVRVYINNILTLPYSVIHVDNNTVEISFIENEIGDVRFI